MTLNTIFSIVWAHAMLTLFQLCHLTHHSNVVPPNTQVAQKQWYWQDIIKQFLDKPKYYGQTKNVSSQIGNGTVHGPCTSGSNSSLVEKFTYQKRAPFATHHIQIHGDMYYSNANKHIHALIRKQHNKVVWEVRKLIMSNKLSRHYTLMNAGRFDEWPQENTVPTWLLPCTCNNQRCYYNTRFNPEKLCIIGHLYDYPPPPIRSPPTKNHHAFHGSYML